MLHQKVEGPMLYAAIRSVVLAKLVAMILRRLLARYGYGLAGHENP